MAKNYSMVSIPKTRNNNPPTTTTTTTHPPTHNQPTNQPTNQASKQPTNPTCPTKTLPIQILPELTQHLSWQGQIGLVKNHGEANIHPSLNEKCMKPNKNKFMIHEIYTCEIDFTRNQLKICSIKAIISIPFSKSLRCLNPPFSHFEGLHSLHLWAPIIFLFENTLPLRCWRLIFSVLGQLR